MEPSLKFNVRNQNISRVDNFIPVRYSRNYLYASFDFRTCDWHGKTKTALFKCKNKEPIPVVLGETDTCIVPWEALEQTEFTVTVYGGNLITVDSAPVKLYESGYRSGDTPEPTPTLYEKVMQSFDETKQYTAEQAELSKRYAVGSLQYPESETDNAKYYSEQSAINAAQTDRDRREVEGLVVQLDEVRQDMVLTEQYKNQAAQSATNALQSETNAKKSEDAAEQSATRAETSEDSAAQWAEDARQSKVDIQILAQQVRIDKSDVQSAKEVVENIKNSVDNTVSIFNQTVKNATDDINFAGQKQIENVNATGQTQTERVQEAGNSALNDIDTAKASALSEINAAGESQRKAVNDAGTAQTKAVNDAGAAQISAITQEGETQVSNVQEAAAEIIADRDQIEINRKNLLKTAIKRTASGKTIALSDSAEMPFVGLKQYGRTTQQTTTGAQLWNASGEIPGYISDAGDIANPSATRNGVYNDYIDISGVASVTYNAQATVGDSYIWIGIGCYDSDKNFISRLTGVGTAGDTSLAGTLSMPAETTYIRISYRKFKDGVLSVCKGSELTDEPYTGGIPSPNPDYPQELVSAGDKGSVEVDVMGAQLLDISKTSDFSARGVTLTNNGDGTLTVTGTTTDGYFVSSASENTFSLASGTYSFSTENDIDPGIQIIVRPYYTDGSYKNIILTEGSKTASFKVDADDIEKVAFFVQVKHGYTVDSTFRVMLNAGSAALPWEPYKPKQSLTMLTPNGLPGIPVSSGGNYTDENGQQWIADYRDWERGVDVKCVGQTDLSNETWTRNEIGEYYTTKDKQKYVPDSLVMCNKSVSIDLGKSDNTMFINNKGVIRINWMNDVDTVEYVAEKMDGGIVYGILDTPIETPIPPEELAAYHALHTNQPYTTIYNDEDCHMEVGYIVDTGNYIAQNYVPKEIYTALEQRVAALEANAINNI